MSITISAINIVRCNNDSCTYRAYCKMRTGKAIINHNCYVFYVRLSPRKCLYKAEAKARMDKLYSQAQLQITECEKYAEIQPRTTVYNYAWNAGTWTTGTNG